MNLLAESLQSVSFVFLIQFLIPSQTQGFSDYSRGNYVKIEKKNVSDSGVSLAKDFSISRSVFSMLLEDLKIRLSSWWEE